MLVMLASCGGGNRDGAATSPRASIPVLTRVVVSLPKDTLAVGDSAAANVAGFDDKGAPMNVGPPTWTTETPKVATVTDGGIVVAVGPGVTTVVAVVAGRQGYSVLTVVPAPVAKISVTPAASTLDIGPEQGLSVALLDRRGNALKDREIRWTSSDPTVAPVSSVGVVTAIASGMATITASSEGLSASATITVTANLVAVASVTVSPPSGSVPVGQSLQLVATLVDGAGNSLPGRRVVWSSSAPNVATVSVSGLVTTVTTGTASIMATVDGQRAASTIVVNDNIFIRIGRPDSLQVVIDTLNVCATITSKAPISNAVASLPPAAGFFATPLVFSVCPGAGKFPPTPAWTGQIVIAQLKSGRYQLVVTATDTLNTVGVASVTFQHQYGHSGGNGPVTGKKQFLPPSPPRKGIP